MDSTALNKFARCIFAAYTVARDKSTVVSVEEGIVDVYNARKPGVTKTLNPGDVVWMGTEGAPANLKHGDVCEIEITGIGTLRNKFVAEKI